MVDEIWSPTCFLLLKFDFKIHTAHGASATGVELMNKFLEEANVLGFNVFDT